MFTLWSNRGYIHGYETKFRSYGKSSYAILLVICDKIHQVSQASELHIQASL